MSQAANIKFANRAEDVKRCEVCLEPIPEDYQNLLCDKHYAEREKEDSATREKISQEIVQRREEQTPTIPEINPVTGIGDPNYQENPEMEDKPQWEANIVQFDKTGLLLWKDTRNMYEFIKNDIMNFTIHHPQYPKFIWRPKIVDVGCGSGVGSNILSQEADFVWGIDKNVRSVNFAREAFTRVRNGIYYSSQVSFDVFDIMKDTRETAKFDMVVAIEVIEHIADTHGFLTNLIKKFNKDKNEPTQYWFSTPNRNNERINKNHPKNAFHVREWTAGELYTLLSKYFTKIELFTAKGEPIPPEQYMTTDHTPLLYRCEGAHL